MDKKIATWVTEASRYIVKNSFLSLRQERRRSLAMGSHSFYILEFPDWVNVVPVTEGGEVVLVRQYRHGLAELNLEIPGGMVDAGEDPRMTASRELAEETGYVPAELELLSRVSVNPAIQNNWCHLYLATGCRREQAQALDGTESIAVEVVSVKRLVEMVGAGIIHHSLNCLAIKLAQEALAAR